MSIWMQGPEVDLTGSYKRLEVDALIIAVPIVGVLFLFNVLLLNGG